jgi:hypothetical protein
LAILLVDFVTIVAVIVSGDPITKMHDSLPMILFRFEILVKFYKSGEPAWVTYEGMSHKQVDTYDRVGWFQMAYIYLMKIKVTNESRPTGPAVKPFGRKAAGPKERRLMGDYQFLIHTTNPIAGIVCEIKLARTLISLQWISTVPVEKKSVKTRMHGGVHRTVVEPIKMMAYDEAI